MHRTRISLISMLTNVEMRASTKTSQLLGLTRVFNSAPLSVECLSSYLRSTSLRGPFRNVSADDNSEVVTVVEGFLRLFNVPQCLAKFNVWTNWRQKACLSPRPLRQLWGWPTHVCCDVIGSTSMNLIQRGYPGPINRRSMLLTTLPALTCALTTPT